MDTLNIINYFDFKDLDFELVDDIKIELSSFDFEIVETFGDVTLTDVVDFEIIKEIDLDFVISEYFVNDFELTKEITLDFSLFDYLTTDFEVVIPISLNVVLEYFNDFVIDTFISPNDYIPIKENIISVPDNVGGLFEPFILTEDDLPILTEDDFYICY